MTLVDEHMINIDQPGHGINPDIVVEKMWLVASGTPWLPDILGEVEPVQRVSGHFFKRFSFLERTVQ